MGETREDGGRRQTTPRPPPEYRKVRFQPLRKNAGNTIAKAEFENRRFRGVRETEENKGHAGRIQEGKRKKKK